MRTITHMIGVMMPRFVRTMTFHLCARVHTHTPSIAVRWYGLPTANSVVRVKVPLCEHYLYIFDAFIRARARTLDMCVCVSHIGAYGEGCVPFKNTVHNTCVCVPVCEHTHTCTCL
jgi:hypothetical protein